MPPPFPNDPGDLLRQLDHDDIAEWLDSLDLAEITRHVLDLDARIRSWKAIAKAVRARQKWHSRHLPQTASAEGVVV